MSARLLVVTHSRSGSTARLRDAVLSGIEAAGGDLDVHSLDATDAGADDVETADAAILLTPARFGAVSGLMKDFLERIYPWFEEVPHRHPGLPYALVVKGASDATGAVRDVTRIVSGLRWREVVEPLVVEGELTDDHLAGAHELGGTVAAGLDAGMW